MFPCQQRFLKIHTKTFLLQHPLPLPMGAMKGTTTRTSRKLIYLIDSSFVHCATLDLLADDKRQLSRRRLGFLSMLNFLWSTFLYLSICYFKKRKLWFKKLWAFLFLILTECEKKQNSVYICKLQSFSVCFWQPQRKRFSLLGG